VVDTKHHLMVAHEVTHVGTDRDQLASIAKQARTAIGAQALTVVADRGYFKGEEILSCQEAGITAIVPKSITSKAAAGQRLIWRFARIERGLKLHRYCSASCQQCLIKAKCTPAKTVALLVGNTKISWRPCKLAWIWRPTVGAFAARPWNIPRGRSSWGWVRRIS
jgi:hypothetical protein